MENELEFRESPYTSFILAIRSSVTREKYLQRFSYFLSYLGNKDGNIESRYLHFHRNRAEKREISACTLENYVKPIKLFCQQLEISLPWKRITRRMPKGRRYANDNSFFHDFAKWSWWT